MIWVTSDLGVGGSVHWAFFTLCAFDVSIIFLRNFAHAAVLAMLCFFALRCQCSLPPTL